jgi:hypothetical protein
MSIIIDGIQFELLCKSVADNLVYEITDRYIAERHRDVIMSPFIGNFRDIVQFRSIKDGKEMILNAYRSSSELGLWRLGYIQYSDCGLNKFNLDYVQGTLLHHLLQKCINENFESLPLVEFSKSKTKLMVTHPHNMNYLERNNYSNLNPEEKKAFIQRHRFIILNFPTIEDERAIDNPHRKIDMEPFSEISIKCETKAK